MTGTPPTVEGLPARLPSLTGGRVILFTVAFMTHALGAARFFENEFVNNLGFIVPSAASTLSLFFVLSGFVLTWQRPWSSRIRDFCRKRAAKILPSHVTIWAITMLMLAVVGPMTMIGQTALPQAFANLFLIQAWIPDPTYVFSVYGINWSVSIDIVFYMALPLLIRPILRIRAERLWMWVVGMMVVIAVWPALVDVFANGPVWEMWAPLSFSEVYWVFFSPVARLPEFVIGILLARMVQTGVWPNLRARWVILFTVLVWFATFFLSDVYRSSGVAAIAVSLFVPVFAMRDIEGRSRWLNRKWMVVLGDATYAAYLFQFPILGVARELVGPEAKFGVGLGALLVLSLFAINLLFGLILYRFVEWPVLRRFGGSSRPRKWADAEPQPQPAVPGTRE